MNLYECLKVLVQIKKNFHQDKKCERSNVEIKIVCQKGKQK